MEKFKNIIKNNKNYWLLLIICLFITILFSGYLFKEARQQARKDFLYQVSLVEMGLDNKISIYEQILKDVVGVFHTMPDITVEQWNSYMNSVRFHDKFPGLKWITYTKINNSLKSSYATNQYIYPDNEETNYLFHYNFSDKDPILKAMFMARNTGKMSISDRVKLINNKNHKEEDNFLMVVPIYEKSMWQSKADRMNNIIGYICSPFSSYYSLESIFMPMHLKVDIKVYDGLKVEAKNLVYKNNLLTNNDSYLQDIDNAMFGLTQIKTYFNYGKSYTIVYSSRPNMTAHNFNWLVIFLIGSTISFSIFFIIRALVFTNQKALKLAEEMTKEIRKNKEELEGLAHYDTLTQVANRYFFKKLLSHAIDLAQRHNHKLALFFIDLDCFKIINDNLGHEVGDLVLKQAASRMKQCLRSVDTVGRLGGDEFVVLIEQEAQIDQISLVASNIIKEINQPIFIDGHTINIGCSIGIAVYPDHATTIEKLMNKADKAMYSIKKQGKNNFFITQ